VQTTETTGSDYIKSILNAHYEDSKLGGWTARFDSWKGQEVFLYTMSRLVLGLTQPPIQRVLGLFPWGKVVRT
jgi:hypothetical protein